MRIKKSNIWETVFIYIIIMMIFENVVKDFLFFIPSSTNYLIRDIFSAICLLLVARLFMLKRLRFDSKINSSLYLLVFFQCFFVPVYSSLLAYLNYGQPMLYGILAERGRMVSISVLLVYYLLLKNKLSLLKIHKMILKLSWLCLVIYLSIRLVYEISPNVFKWDEISISKGLTIIDARTIDTKGGVIMRVGLSLFVYTIICYFIEYIDKRKLKSLFKMLCFLSFIVLINKGRGVLAFTSITLLICYWFYANATYRLVAVLVGVLLIGAFSYGIINVSKNEKSPSFVSSYVNIIDGISEAKKGNTSSEDIESSTWARVYSLGVVSDAFSASNFNWIFGTGTLSNQYNDGFKGKFSEFFYPVDIGVAGALFLYGVVIVMLFKLLFIHIYKKLKAFGQELIYIKTMRYFMLYFFIASIQTGSDIMGVPEIFLLFICFASFCEIKNKVHVDIKLEKIFIE